MLAAALIALPAALLMSVSTVGGVDMDYEGEVDIYSGSPIAEESEVKQATALADGGMYDSSAQMFIYTVPGGNQAVYSSVANEMITTASVNLSTDEGISARLYLDGEEQKDADISNISAPGKYSLVVYGNDVEYRILSFTIVTEKTGAIDFYQLPVGFDVTEVSVSGQLREKNDTGRVDMSQEGDYLITYRCNLIDLYYTLNVTIDHTPPKVTYEGVKDGTAKGPVTMKGLKKSDTVEIKCNGQDFTTPEDNVIDVPGKYEVTVTDEAGNSVTDKFEIKFFMNFQGVLFGLLFVAVIGTAAGYMIWSRKRLKVR